MGNSWKIELENKIQNDIVLQEISDYLTIQKENGMKREEVKIFLNHLRTNKRSEQTDDRILEILDIVEGFCDDKFKVW